MRACLRCGVDIAHKRPTAVWCSGACRAAGSRDRRAALSAVQEAHRVALLASEPGWTLPRDEDRLVADILMAFAGAREVTRLE